MRMNLEVPWELDNPRNPRVQALEKFNTKLQSAIVPYSAVIQHSKERSIRAHKLVWATGSWQVNISDTSTKTLPGKICQITDSQDHPPVTKSLALESALISLVLLSFAFGLSALVWKPGTLI